MKATLWKKTQLLYNPWEQWHISLILEKRESPWKKIFECKTDKAFQCRPMSFLHKQRRRCSVTHPSLRSNVPQCYTKTASKASKRHHLFKLFYKWAISALLFRCCFLFPTQLRPGRGPWGDRPRRTPTGRKWLSCKEAQSFSGNNTVQRLLQGCSTTCTNSSSPKGRFSCWSNGWCDFTA